MAQVHASQSQGVPVEGEVEATPSELSQYIGQYGIGSDIIPVHGLAPAPPKEAPPPPPQIILDEVQFGDGEARHCLEKWAKSTWFSQRGIADKLSLSKIVASNTFVIKLNTFNEVRTLHEDFRPYYLGEHIDDCHHGFPPGAWQIPLAPRRLYKNETFSMRLPHTDYIKRCHNCWGSGRVQCTTCHGHGHIHCTHCHGSGKIEVSVNKDGVWVKEHNHCHHCHHGHMNCHTCHTHGYVECIVCKGRGRLVHFIRLDVVWKNNKKTTVVHPAISNDPSDERDRLLAPSEKLADAQGPLIHFEEDLLLQPRHPAVALRVNEEVHNQANLILQDTLNPNALTHRQRMKIRGVPTYKIYYTWKGKPGLFWVMGTDRKVHAPKFPRSPVRIMIAVLLILTLLVVIGALVGTALYFFL